ncbi:MAG TPA: arginine deiminase [Mycobacteriales bacterium]|jgi:arginine deiminase|nr:arginine deiminase [Mycobacteriales bacterium]
MDVAPVEHGPGGSELAERVPVEVDSEVGPLRSVVLHRPGDELRRLTPRNSADLLFDGIPWVERAQAEHDAFAATLRARGIEVLLLRDLLRETLAASPAARGACVDAAVSPAQVGPRLAPGLRADLQRLDVDTLLEVLICGLRASELAAGLAPSALLPAVSAPGDFVIPPLPNLLFTRDSAVVTGSHVAVTRPSMPARRREVVLTGAIWAHHPRLGSTPHLDTTAATGLEGGDVLVLGDGVLAIGVGQRTTPAGAELLAQRAFAAATARVVLAVPIAQERATMHLDTVCTMVDTDAVVMYQPAVATAEAWTLTPYGITGPEPFLRAAARALDLDVLRVVDTGPDPVAAEREQWDDGNNTLAVAPGVVVAYERNVRTNARLIDAGVEVLPIAGSELGSGRGGPRCLSCPIARSPLT